MADYLRLGLDLLVLTVGWLVRRAVKQLDDVEKTQKEQETRISRLEGRRGRH